MYIPKYFEESRPEVLQEVISKNPFAILCIHGKNGLDANHLPFVMQPVEGKLGILHSHVARANPVWSEIADGDEVLVVFRAGHAYVSPNWYPSKEQFHNQVPTWNYIVVHAHGRVTVREDENYLRDVVTRLTQMHEAPLPRPWKVTDSPKKVIDPMLKAIVGLEVEITRLVGKFKLGQNKDIHDIRGAAEALKQQGEEVISEAMLRSAEQKDK
ncbi:FMN-binding negative transcriptional regulator [bacterium]|nr:FMN-binding negative transcriptional regulator [bacterium]